MSFTRLLKTGLIACMFAATLSLASVPAQSGHQQVYINGQLVQPALVAEIEQAIGVALPSGAYGWDGQYLYDGYGNSVPLYIRGPGPSQYSYNPGGGGGQHTDIIIDPSGGCEAGSCVNIIDRW